ncbi:MAG: ABC transporter permease [Anaerolineae bacterium]|nr:ABC transporter permease [Anaerolineae bacterium]
MRRLRQFFSRKLNWVALAIVGTFLLMAFAAPWLSPPLDAENPANFQIHEGWIEVVPQPPSAEAPLGTVIHYQHGLGGVYLLHFDVFHSFVWGTRSVLRFGLITALATAILGTVIGAISGYVGGPLNTTVMRLTDAFLAFPVIAGVWLFRMIMGLADVALYDFNNLNSVPIPQTLFQRIVLALDIDPVMLALIAFSWVAYARMMSVSIIKLKQMEFTEAAKSLGMRNIRMIVRHLIPNAIGPIIVLLARDVGGMVIQQAAFAFIGVSGTVDSTAIPEWSRMLILGRNWVIGPGGDPFLFWWTYLPVTAALVMFGIGWNLLGDGLNAFLNPWEAKRR